MISGGGSLLGGARLLLMQGTGIDISLANVVSSIMAALTVFTVSRLHIFEPPGGVSVG